MINLTTKTTWVYFDKHGMPVVQGDKESINDSVGRLVLMGIAYGFIPEIKKALESCLKFTMLYRHPTNKVPTSRDHISYFCVYRKLIGVSIPKFPFMRGLYLWMHSLTGNKLAERLYYLIYIPGALIGNIWLRICRWVGGIGPERDNNWWIGEIKIFNKIKTFITNGLRLQHSRTKWQKLWGQIISISIPAYALHNKAWQIYVMPDSKRKEKLKRILLKRVGKSNIMLRLLFGDKTVTQQEVDNYPHLTGYRPGAYLNTTNRTIREMTPEESAYNSYEYDLVLWLWQNK